MTGAHEGRTKTRTSALRVSGPAVAPYRRLEADLRDALPPAQSEIVSLLGVHNFLVCVTVAGQARSAGRLILPKDKLARVGVLLDRLGMHWRRARFDLYSPDPMGGAAQHAGRLVNCTDDPSSRAVVHLGVSEDFPDAVAQLEGQIAPGAGSLLGRLFGYPDCCTRAFTRSRSKLADRTPSMVPSLGPFPAPLNPVVPNLYGLAPLFHFPCSPDCEPSRQLWSERLAFLETLVPSAASFRALGSGIAFYGAHCGAALATRHRQVGRNSYFLDEVLCSHPADLPWAALEGQPEVRVELLGPHAFTIAGQLFADDRHVAAMFG